jgi:transposase
LRFPAFLKLTFAPGECAQVDWGQFGSIRMANTSRRLSFFVMVLCYIRLLYGQFTLSETMEHFLDAHAKASSKGIVRSARTAQDTLWYCIMPW